MKTELIRGDKGKDVVNLQTLLNRVGAMLTPDGDFGPATERAVRYAREIAGQQDTGASDQSLTSWLEAQPEPFPPLPTNGVAFIAREETGGIQYYNTVARWPHYPGEKSGITIGVGYDLRFATEPEFRDLWGPSLQPSAIDELSADIGKPGTKKRAAELNRLGIEIPFRAAWPVFVKNLLPDYYEATRKIYPAMPRLPDLCRAVLVSIVFNRGPSLKGPARSEMREIGKRISLAYHPSVTRAERKETLMYIEDQIVSMQRLWPLTSGLRKRRQSEANMWREGLSNL